MLEFAFVEPLLKRTIKKGTREGLALVTRRDLLLRQQSCPRLLLPLKATLTKKKVG